MQQHLHNLAATSKRGDAREESYYEHPDDSMKKYAEIEKVRNSDMTILK